MTDGTLHRYILNNSNKIIDKWMHYPEIYERHLQRFRGKSPVFVEIGVFGGGSLGMWKEYFGEGSKIVGIDINPDCKAHEAEGIEVIIGSQDDPAVIDLLFEKHPNVDIILDDGSHVMNHMIATFNLVFERISANGVYIAEDTHTCYWHEFGGGFRHEESFIEFMKKKVDEIHASFTQDQSALSQTAFTKSAQSISFYDSVTVVEKRPQSARQQILTRPM